MLQGLLYAIGLTLTLSPGVQVHATGGVQAPSQGLDLRHDAQLRFSTLHSKLLKRESILTSLLVEFEAETRYAGKDEPTSVASGWEAFAGSVAGIEVETSSRWFPAKTSLAVWDGVVSKERIASQEQLSTLVLTDAPGDPWSAYSPLQFGFKFHGRPLSQLFAPDNMKHLECIGTEDLGERHCIVVAVNADSQLEGRIPWTALLWIDDTDSLLALKILLLAKEAAPQGASKDFQVTVLNKQYLVEREWQVAELYTVTPEFSIPVKSFFRERFSNSITAVSVDPSLAVMNEYDVIRPMLHIPQTEWYLVNDKRLGVPRSDYVISPHGQPSVTMASYVTGAIRECRARGITVPTFSEEDINFETLGCGPRALLTAVRCVGLDWRQLLAADAALYGLNVDNNHSLSDIEQLANRIGFTTLTARTLDLDQLAAVTSNNEIWVIAHLVGYPESTTEGHWAIVRLFKETVDILSPPFVHHSVSTSQFSNIFTGYVLMLAHPQSDALVSVAATLNADMEQNSGWSTNQHLAVILTVMIGFALAAAFLWRLRFLRPTHKC